MIKAVGHIQTQPVDVKCIYPEFHTFQEVIGDSGIMKVQLDQFKMSLPALIPEAVVIAVIAAEVDMEPVFVRGIALFLQYILERPESASHMVENTVQYDLHTVLVETLADVGKVFVGTETAVDLLEIPRIIAVVVRFEDRVEQDGIDAKIPQIF